jgi:hypothetical protein
MAHRIALKVMFVCALVLAASAMLAASPFHYPRAPVPYPRAPTTCPGPSSPVDGVPAIRPRNGCTPSFTEQDVRSYLAANRQLALAFEPNYIAFVGTPQIVSIQFLSLHALNLNRDPYAPAWRLSDRVVCYVSLQGTYFPIYGPRRLPDHPVRHFPRSAYIVFDAHTGNVLDSGFDDLLG